MTGIRYLFKRKCTYHSLLSESADLLDSTRSSLLEADAVDLSSMLDVCSCLSLPSNALHSIHPSFDKECTKIPAIRGLHQTERTLLWRWMVYSRATTSSMAERPLLPAGFLVWVLEDMARGEGCDGRIERGSLGDVVVDVVFEVSRTRALCEKSGFVGWAWLSR